MTLFTSSRETDKHTEQIKKICTEHEEKINKKNIANSLYEFQ